jgi:pyruvate dehydrogenase (quinone)
VYCELVSTHEQLPRILQVAMRSAPARGGVAVVVVPGEIFRTEAGGAGEPAVVRAVSPVIRPDEASLAAAADVLNAAGRVTIMAGAGCAGAHDQLIALAGRCRRRWCTRSAARSSSSTTIPTTSG